MDAKQIGCGLLGMFFGALLLVLRSLSRGQQNLNGQLLVTAVVEKVSPDGGTLFLRYTAGGRTVQGCCDSRLRAQCGELPAPGTQMLALVDPDTPAQVTQVMPVRSRYRSSAPLSSRKQLVWGILLLCIGLLLTVDGFGAFPW